MACIFNLNFAFMNIAHDLTQSVHDKICIGMHRVVKFLIFRILLTGLVTRLGCDTDRKYLRNPGAHSDQNTVSRLYHILK